MERYLIRYDDGCIQHGRIRSIDGDKITLDFGRHCAREQVTAVLPIARLADYQDVKEARKTTP